MKIRFKTDFANNWKAGDIVDANYLDTGDVLVDGVAIIDARLLFEACEVIDGKWVNLAEELKDVFEEESEEESEVSN
jgi:hypothetical protein